MKRFFFNLGSAMFITATVFAIFSMKTGAQSGTISGRIINEDGGGAPNVTVTISSVKANQQALTQRGGGDRVSTDEEGNFKFTGVAPGVYIVNVFESKGYVQQSPFSAETQEQRYCRVGDNVTIMMVRGGVITGRVTTANGEPMVGVRVYAVMVRDPEGRSLKRQANYRARMTDDRGVYRLYGLAPGTHVIYTRADILGPAVSPYEGNAPTYHPSSTRDTAAEITVTNGSEATGIDIRYRGDRGRVVSGTVAGGPENASSNRVSVGVNLTSISTGNVIGNSAVRPGENANAFAIYGVPDGEYEIVARRTEYDSVEAAASAPRRITVKGADVTGIELRLTPMASISGRIVFEAAQSSCENKRKSSLEEIAMQTRRDGRAGGAVDSPGILQSDTAPNEKGEFAIFNLQGGRYFLEPKLPNETWYPKSITVNAPSPAAANPRGPAKPATPTDVARAGIALKVGEKLTGLNVTVADGGASLRGKVVAGTESTRLPSRVRVHLIPAEDAAGDNVLRYAETLIRGDGSFGVSNLAPGKYWLVARAAADDEPIDRPLLPAAWDAVERAKLRREASTMKNEVELQPCARAKDYVLRFRR
jgi:hypothetical protein